MAKADKPKNEITVVGNADHMAQAASALEALDRVTATTEDTAKELAKDEINTMNEYGLGLQMKTIRPLRFPEFTTRQQAMRFAAWLLFMAEALPEEEPNHTFPEIAVAIANT